MQFLVKDDIMNTYLTKWVINLTKVMFVCLGNICRSPMAEFLFKDLVKKKGLENEFYIASAATSTEAVGSGIHPGTKEILFQHNIKFDKRTAVQFTKNDYEEFDYIIGMDSSNIRNLLRMTDNDPQGKVYKLLDFCGGGDVKDPWYTGNFTETYDDITRGLDSFLNKIK